jgi:putative membrane protein
MRIFKIIAIVALFPLRIAAADAKFSDPQIAAVVVSANQVDIDAGKLAKERASSPEVKALAEKMINDHTSVNNQAKALVSKLKVTPQDNDTSKKLTEDGKNTRDRLASLTGPAFDKAYVDNEVAYHEAVIGVVKNNLIPDASNKDLKNLLVKSSPVFAEHLEHAKKLKEELNK